jgi:AcrR family transcriptional regulator
MHESAVKEKIIDVASRLFYEQGYNLTGINQVIEEADIARGSLYNHFDSKTDLLLAYLERFQENWYASLEEFLKPIKNPKKKLLALFDFRISNQQKMGFGGCAFIKINDEVGKDEARIIEKVRENKDIFRNYVRKSVSVVEHKKLLSDEALTDMVYLLMEGGVTSAAIFKDPKDLKAAQKVVGQLL